MSTRTYCKEQRSAMRRHVVNHDYHDHAFDEETQSKTGKQRRGPRGGVTIPFPLKLHTLLQDNEYPDVISWQPHGRCFLLRKPKVFLEKVMKKHFKQTKLTSFQRQLNLYGFNRLTSGPDKSGYYHELFLRGRKQLCTRMIRIRIKGTRTKAASNPDSEPDFYNMPTLEDLSVEENTPHEQSYFGALSTRRAEIENTFQSPQHKDCMIGHGQHTPVCISSPSSIASSSSRPISPFEAMRTTIPLLPISMDCRYTSPRPMKKYELDAQECSTIYDIPRLPEPQTQEGTLMFEGKGFHYLDSSSLSFDESDEIHSSFNAQENHFDMTGLSVNFDGKLTSFDV